MNCYFKMVAWFVSFLICLAIPPLLIVWMIAVVLHFARKGTHYRYRREIEWRDRDTPPRGYRSGQALINNRRKA